MTNIFINLLNLYSRNNNGINTPIEDFTTEIFASILTKDNELLTTFMNEVLLVEGCNFKIETQQKYYLQNDIDYIVDVVIHNQDTLCFLENKVNSPEGYRQLERYKKVLEQFQKQNNIHLRYCTKHYDLKQITDINFHQIRWQDIHRFLLDHDDDSMIADFLDYLRRMDMAGDGDFNFNDMLVMNNFLSTMSKLDQCLDSVTPEFTEAFGAPYIYDYERLKQIPKFNRYAIWKDDVFKGGNKSDSKIILGFDFTTEEPQSYPTLFIGIVCNKKHNNHKNIMLAIEGFSSDHTEVDEDIWGWNEKPLSDFLPLENQFMEIKKWFGGRGRALHSNNFNFAGVYILHNKSKDLYYVGQGKQVLNRVNSHFTGKGNEDVYADYKYGDEWTIKAIALENSGYHTLNELERNTIEAYDSFENGYNRTRGNKS